jgi:hypothetical protein
MGTHRISVDDPLYAAIVRYVDKNPGTDLEELEDAAADSDSPWDLTFVEEQVNCAVANADLVEANHKYWATRYLEE